MLIGVVLDSKTDRMIRNNVVEWVEHGYCLELCSADLLGTLTYVTMMIRVLGNWFT